MGAQEVERTAFSMVGATLVQRDSWAWWWWAENVEWLANSRAVEDEGWLLRVERRAAGRKAPVPRAQKPPRTAVQTPQPEGRL
jgi:hypothetical protein